MGHSPIEPPTIPFGSTFTPASPFPTEGGGVPDLRDGNREFAMKLLGFLNAAVLSVCLALNLAIPVGDGNRAWFDATRFPAFSMSGENPFRMAHTGDFADIATAAIGIALFSTLAIAALAMLRRKIGRRQFQ
jgi:hypothetical protein